MKRTVIISAMTRSLLLAPLPAALAQAGEHQKDSEKPAGQTRSLQTAHTPQTYGGAYHGGV